MSEYNLSFMQTAVPKPEIMATRKQVIDKIIEELAEQGIQVFYLNGREISSKETFLRKAAEAMQFPAYFGANWDAFDECITDLTWFSAESYVLLYERPDIFAQAEPTQWQIAVNILRSAEEYWQSANKPLNVFFVN
ncbi:barnase inhibitor [Scytonema hofmannii PCC 7110]|jgi:RNAse (barnase) inhibitor barstar|uniref:Barnase inhibitor n=1 Tax=Scytonema hofmannii PCC 7110 TaxID=128403 RepID=A0A139XDB8_9CYAN|nr:barstar family protein [Scytonema hofmannii]KYC42701.1 barnase inhibitor [Scytonema hofmannii PCC 7110]